MQLQSDPQLFDRANVVRSDAHSVSVPRTSDVVPFVVPLVTHANHTCTATFTTQYVRVPSDLITGSTDTRELGVHFLHFLYLR